MSESEKVEQPFSTWKVGSLGRALTALVMTFAALIGVGGILTGDLLAVALSLWAVPHFWSIGFLSKIELHYPSRITVQNGLVKRHVSISNIYEIKLRYQGLTIKTFDGRTIIATAIQKPILVTRYGIETRSERVAKELMNAVIRQQGNVDAAPAERAARPRDEDPGDRSFAARAARRDAPQMPPDG